MMYRRVDLQARPWWRVPVSIALIGATAGVGVAAPVRRAKPKAPVRPAASSSRKPPASTTRKPAKSPAPAKVEPAKAADPFARGMALVRAGKYAEALPFFEADAAKNPSDGVVRSWIGFALLKLERYDPAIQAFEEALRLAPKQADTYNNLGNAYLAKNDVPAAIRAYRQAIELVRDTPSGHSDLYYNLGNALAREGELIAAQDAFLQAVRRSPNDALVYNNLGVIHERRYVDEGSDQLLDQAVEYYRKAAELKPNEAVFQRNLGLAARKLEARKALALPALRAAVRLDPKDYSSHLALAEDYQNAGDVNAAINAYRAAAALRPMEFVPRYNLGLLYAREARDLTNEEARQARYRQSLVFLRQAHQLRQDDHRVYSALGWVCFNSGNLTDAADWYQKSVGADPQNRAYLVNLGLVMDRLQRADDAIKYWSAALKLEAGDDATRTWLAAAYLRKKEWAAAAREYAELTRREKADASVYNNYGLALERQGKLEEAIAAYKRATELDPKLAVAFHNLAGCYHQRGEKELAREYYQRALQVNPKLDDARKNLERLGS